MPLMIWDAALGASREATQLDIDVMQAKINAFGRFTTEWAETQNRMQSEIGEIQRRYQTAAELSGSINV